VIILPSEDLSATLPAFIANTIFCWS